MAAMEMLEKKYISSEDLKTHNSPSDLWISIQGKVYDVTNWVKDHPGGEIPLLDLAGQDVTDAFMAHHPASAWKLFDRFFAGYYLSDYQVSEVSKDYRRLVLELSKHGLFDEKGHGVFFSFFFMLVMFFTSIYLVVGSTSLSSHIAAGVIIGYFWIQTGWVGHDSGHYNIMISPWLNRLAQIITGNCLAGVSIGWWKRTHNAHHVACNSLDFDPDVQHFPFFAVSSTLFKSLKSYFHERILKFDSIARFLISYQHLTFYPVMCFARLNLHAQSILHLVSKKKVQYRWLEIAGLMVFWIWYPYLISFLPNWRERVMFIAINFALTGIQHVQFCLSHFSSSVYVGQPQGNDWFEKQTMGTLDIDCSPWMDWFHGGLQFQVEHHLFPRLPRCQLRRIVPLVKELCKKHKLQYSCVSFMEGNKRTVATLRSAAMQARKFENSSVRNLVWEALNTHG